MCVYILWVCVNMCERLRKIQEASRCKEQHPTLIPSGSVCAGDKTPSQQASTSHLNSTQPHTHTHTHTLTANTSKNTHTLWAMQQQPLPRGMGHLCVELNQTATEQTIRAQRINVLPNTLSHTQANTNTHTHTHTHTHWQLWLIYCQQHSEPDQPDQPPPISSNCRGTVPADPELQFHMWEYVPPIGKKRNSSRTFTPSNANIYIQMIEICILFNCLLCIVWIINTPLSY